MAYDVFIEVDVNDGDYISSNNEMSNKQLAQLKRIVNKVKGFKPYTSDAKGYQRTHNHNWPTDDCCRKDLGEKGIKELYNFSDDDMEFIDEYFPYGDYGCHTLTSVIYHPCVDKTVLL